MESQDEVTRAKMWDKSYALGAAVGVGYGVMFRLSTSTSIATNPTFAVSATMTFSFLALGSLCIGLLTVYPAERARRRSAWLWPLLPAGPVVFACLLSVLFKIEGWICMIFALPGALLCAAIGGVVGGVVARRREVRSGTMACLVMLPVLLAQVEVLVDPPTQERVVKNEILIHASPEVVWRNIERVPAIAPAELQTTWAQRIGFPRPVEATLSYEGVGGVRHASFERGLTFLETVTTWEPERRLAFTIKADTASIPPTTLDEHVTIGGRYFDVLDGEYRIEPQGNGEVRLHLTSRQRLSTDFNAYAGMWTDAVMDDLQGSILEVIQHRCEAQAKR